MGDPLIPGSGVDLVLVAKRQRFLIWCILLEIVLNCISPFTVLRTMPGGSEFALLLATICVLALHVCVLVGFILLMVALRRHVVWMIVCGLFMVVPVINLLVLLSVNSQATRRLRAAGVKVGLMGANEEVVRRTVDTRLCKQCGYDLTGNVSGICPECGAFVPVQPRW